MSRRQYQQGDENHIKHALTFLRYSLVGLKLAGARKTAARVRLAISSAKGAVRNIENMKAKAERIHT